MKKLVKRKFIKLFFFLIISLLIFPISGCQGGGISGKYYQYDGEVKNEELWFELKSGNKWADDDGMAGRYELNGDKITFYSEVFGEEEELMSGTVKDGVLTFSLMGMTQIYKKDGATGSGDIGEQVPFYSENKDYFSQESQSYSTSNLSISNGMVKTLNVSNFTDELYLRVPYNTKSISLADYISSSKRWDLCEDKDGKNQVSNTVIEINPGQRKVYYIFLPEESKSIKLTIEQKSTFLVSYYDQYGKFIITHHYATDSYLSVPDFEYTANLGYSEYKWAYLASDSYQVIEDPSEFLAQDGLNIRVSPIANEYNLTLDPDGGNVNQATKTIRYNDFYELPVPSKEGHTFIGWYQNEIQYTDEEGIGLSSWRNTENASLKAIYTINDYEVTLTKNNERSGEISINNGGTNSSFDFDSLVTVIAKTTTNSILKDEYSFLGWYNGEDLLSTEMEYTFNMPAHALNLQARWTIKQYTITYNLNGGLNDKFNPESYNVDDEIELRDPSKGTNTFAGWYDNIDFEGQAIFSIPQDSKGNKVFYAKWFSDEQATFGLNYILVDDGYYVAAGNEGSKNIVIPEFYSGKPVVGIDDYGFMNTDIESISIPSSIVYIGENAFWNCKKLTSIIIPDSVQTIGKNTFGGCTTLTEITLPFIGASIDATGSEAVFGYVFSSTSFEGSYTARQYYSYEYAVYYLSLSLTTVTITGGDLKPGCFYNCSSLVSITIPDTVSSIDENTFYNCTNLLNINVDKENENFTDTNGVLFNKSQTILMHYPAGKSGSYSIPAQVTEIKAYAFRNCVNLTAINIPNSITQIGDSAFMGCSSLESVRLPDDLSDLVSSTFMDCTGLESVFFNSSLKSIGANAFSGCISLSKLTIPDSVTSIGSSAFGGCRGLSEMTLPFIGSGRNASQTNSLFGYIFGTTYYEGSYSAKQFYYYNQYYPQSYNATYYIPSGLDTITITGGIVNYGAFFNCINIKTVSLLEVTEIEDYAFAFCISIEEMVFPDTITKMGNYILSNCNSIESITVPYLSTTVAILFGSNICSKIKTMTVTGGTMIPESAFSGCNNLTTVVISDSVTSIGRNAFRGCENLTEMTLPFVGSKINASPDLALFGYIFGNTSFTGSIAVEQYYSETGKVIYNLPAKLTKLTITGGEIKYGAFSNCSNLTTITLPEGVISIGDKAFYNCTSLTSLNMPESVTSIGREVFTNCKLEYQVYDGNLKYLGNWLIDTVNTNITNVNFKDNTIGIYDKAFANCINIISIVIPDTVQSIGSGAFSGCTGLEEITLPFVGESISSSNQYFGFIFGATSYGTNVNYVPSSLKKVTIKDGQIASNAFYGCKNLTSVNISDKVNKIGEGAFVGCSGLTEMTLPFVGTGETTQASEMLFGYIFGQTFYTGSITTDQFYTDYNTMTYYIPENLRDVVITGGSINYGAFYNCTTLTSITLPEKLTSIGEKAFHNCNKLVSITIPKSVHSIGDSAFAGCSKLQNVNIAEDSELTTIGFSAFQNCTSLLSITIPDGITSLYGAFSGCSSLVAVVISENSKLNYIGDNAFSYCTNLEAISIPEGVTSISQNAFYNSNKIIYDIYDNNLKYLGNWLMGTVGKTLETATLKAETIGIYYSAFENCSNLTSINIPQEVMIIYDKAFLGCSNLVTVNFAENSKLKYLGEYVFSACSNLVNINLEVNSQLEKLEENLFSNSSSLVSLTIPSSVTSIGEYTFSGCTNLATILLPESLTSIGNNAFNNCLSLRSLIIPDSVETIGSGALSGCSNLTELRVPFVGSSLNATDANALFGYIFGKYSYSNAINTVQYYSSVSSTSFYIPLSLKKVEITGTKLNYGAFYNCSMIEEIVFNNMINIGEVAFYNCSGLISMTIPSTTTNIGRAAFDKCLNLTYVFSNNPTPPEMIEAFSNNNIGLKIYVPEEARQSYQVNNSWSNYKNIIHSQTIIDENGFAIQEGLLVQYLGDLVDITIPNSVSKIGAYAFRDSIESITIPDSVVELDNNAFKDCINLNNVVFLENSQLELIGNYAFYGCLNLVSIVIPASVIKIGQYAFNGNTSLRSVIFDPNGQLNIIDDYAFSNCDGLELIIIPASVTEIGYYAFKFSDNLRTVMLKSLTPPVLEYGAFENNLSVKLYVPYESLSSYQGANNWKNYSNIYSETIIDENGFAIQDGRLIQYHGSLNEVRIPDSVTQIGAYAFDYRLISVTIPASITKIDDYAFKGCSNLKTVIFEEDSQLQSIGNYAFSDCLELESIALPANLTSIGVYAFSNCSKLSVAEIPSGVSALSDYLFNGCNGLIAITLTEGLNSIGAYAFNGCTSLKSINLPASLVSISSNAFSGCSGLEEMTLPFVGESKEATNSSSLFGYIFGTTSYSGSTEITQVYNSSSIKYYIPSGLVKVNMTGSSIKDGAFSNCLMIKEITINNVTNIGSYAFSGCSSLLSITLPASISDIGNNAFSDCSDLASVFLNATTPPVLGTGVFTNNGSGRRFYVPSLQLSSYKSAAGWASFSSSIYSKTIINSNGFAIQDGKLIQYTGNSTNITVPSNVSSIGNYAFNNRVIRVELLSGVTTITEYSFRNYRNIAEIVVASGNNYFSSIDGVLYDKSGTKLILYPKGRTATTYSIPDGVLIIGKYAFKDCIYLNSITMPSSLTDIEEYAFIGSSSLKSVNIPNSVNHIGNYIFSGCSSLSEIALPFLGNSKETGMLLGYLFGTEQYQGSTGVQQKSHLGMIATFYLPSGLRKVTVNGGAIAYGAFYGCSLLNQIYLNNVTRIDAYAFNNCNNFTLRLSNTTPPTLDSYALYNTSSLTIYVPTSSLFAYKNTNVWKNYSNIIYGF